MRKKYLGIGLFLFCFIFGLAQQSPQSFSLQEALEFAKANNTSNKNAVLDKEVANQQKREAVSTGLPQINANIGYQYWLKQQISLLPAVILSEEDRNQLGLSLTDQFPVTFGTKQNLKAEATLSQLLFSGSYLVGLKSAKHFLEISKNISQKTEIEIRKLVVNHYVQVLVLEENIKVFKKNINIVEANLYEVKKLWENGMTEEENAEQLQITLNELKSNVAYLERNRELAVNSLNFILGLQFGTKIQLTDSLEFLALSNMENRLLEAEFDLENHIDYKIAENSHTSNELLLKLEKTKALPTLSAFLNAGYVGNSDQFTFAQKSQKWFGSSLVGVNLDIPIFSALGRTAATQKAKLNLQKSELQLYEVEQQLRLEVQQAKSNYQHAKSEIENKKQNVELAIRIERKNQIKFKEGVGDSFALKQAQMQLYNAQQAYLQSMQNLIVSKNELEIILNK